MIFSENTLTYIIYRLNTAGTDKDVPNILSAIVHIVHSPHRNAFNILRHGIECIEYIRDFEDKVQGHPENYFNFQSICQQHSTSDTIYRPLHMQQIVRHFNRYILVDKSDD